MLTDAKQHMVRDEVQSTKTLLRCYIHAHLGAQQQHTDPYCMHSHHVSEQGHHVFCMYIQLQYTGCNSGFFRVLVHIYQSCTCK